MRLANEEAKVIKKEKKKISLKKKILLLILALILLIITFVLGYSGIQHYRIRNFKSQITKVKQEEVINLVVEINPSILLKVKNNTVIDSKCLNEDCEELLKSLNYTYDDNINNQKVKDVVEMIYIESKNNGYDTSNGINISSSSSSAEILINDIKETNFKKITFEEESMILENNGFNIKEEQLSKEEYNNKILKELKKDSDYGSGYSCGIYDGEVKCYLEDFIGKAMENFGNENFVFDLVNLEVSMDKFKRILKKFDIEYELESPLTISEITLKNGKTYYFQANYIVSLNNGNNEFTYYRLGSSLYYTKYIEGKPNDYGHVPILEDKIFAIPIKKIELFSHKYNNEDIISIDQNEQTISNYYLIK